jgi:hypothetical protein
MCSYVVVAVRPYKSEVTIDFATNKTCLCKSPVSPDENQIDTSIEYSKAQAVSKAEKAT